MSLPEPVHQPVLVEPLVELLDPRPGCIVLDATVGLGGHAAAILPLIAPGGRYIGLDIDNEMLAQARERLAGVAPDVALDLVPANFADAAQVLGRLGVRQVDRVLIDLGVNSAQLDDAARGFSFDREGPLDMRFDRQQREQAIDLVNGLGESALADLFYHYGQESQSRKIARQICAARRQRRISTTRELAGIVAAAVDRPPGAGRTHPATRVFQALRIAVNHEIENIERFLAQIPEILAPGGRLAVIAFHSIEDGLAKRFLREQKQAGTMRELTRRPIVADAAEIRANPRSRSAKLRVAQRG